VIDMRDTYLRELYCSATGEVLPSDRLLGLSPAGKPILCRYDLEAIRREVDRDEVGARPRGMWRWRELLPLPAGAEPVTLGEGDTPLLSAARLGEALGLRRVWVKDESGNPTGSFKARGIAAAVTMAVRLGARAFAIPSAGNAGGALAAYAARAGLPSHVFVPADTPVVNQREVLLYGGRLYRVDGLIDDCGRMVAARRDALQAFDVSTLKEPYRIEGKKTMGLELAQQLGWRVPDVIVYPTGGGTGLIGMRKAFDELAALGWIDAKKRPRFVSVQSTGCAPIVRAFQRGESSAPRWPDAATRAYGLRVPAAVGDFLMLDALRETGGTAVAVDDDALLHDAGELGRLTGINACPEGGACVTALRHLVANGFVQEDDEVVVFNTGAGTKYVETLPALPTETLPAPAR
jgi:threonine synthase